MRSFCTSRNILHACLIVTLIVSRSWSAAPDKDHPLVNSLGMRFVPVPIPGGKPVLFGVWKTRVKDFDAFVTDAHYDATRDMFSLTPKGQGDHNIGNWKAPGFSQTELNPVCGVSYVDALAFCAWLSKKESKHYRLPTDHEWSCAVGIGDKERAEDGPRGNHRKVDGVYPWGKQWPPPKGAGNYAGEECRGAPGLPKNYVGIKGYRDEFIFTSPVGSFDPNPLGLYDLGGNLWEWCQDWLDEDHRHRVLRGGSWGDDVPICMLASYRRHELPADRGVVFGFRVVMEE
ncbi:MAG TPA: SUMF1/EgtB/PvdO family nonheme iron enzyme [Humisphaera sp.]|nr:SUMF1/EgtB/PvdO family nonheme iron enzyme [Humisphaera sp.]